MTESLSVHDPEVGGHAALAPKQYLVLSREGR